MHLIGYFWHVGAHMQIDEALKFSFVCFLVQTFVNTVIKSIEHQIPMLSCNRKVV